MRARGGAGVSVGQGVEDAGDARPRAGSARPRRVGRVLAPGARREPASRASRGAREKRFKRRARDGGFPPARCFVGSAAEGKSDHAGSPLRRLSPRPGRVGAIAGEDPSRSRSGSRPSRRRPARRTRADAARAPRRRIIARQKSPGRLTWVRGREYGKASGARARAPRTSRRAPTRSARIRSPSARRRFAATRVDRPMCVRRSPRARRRKWRARGCRSLGAGKRFRSGHAKPRFPARGGHKSAVSVREISGESKSPIARPHVESRRMGPIATCPSRVKDPD